MSTLGKARFVGLAAATVMVLAGSACGGDGGQDSASAPIWVTPTSSPPTSAPTRLKEITSACKLLPAAVVVKVLGGSASTRLTAEEQPAEKVDAHRRYSCSYGRGDREALSFIVQVNPDRADTVRESIDAIAKGSGVKTTRIDNLGAGAVTYVVEGARVLAVAVPYGKELRVLVFTGPAIVPQSRITQLAEHVVAQI